MTNSLWSTEWTYFQNAFSSNSCTQTLIWLKKNACSVKNKAPLIQSKHRRIIFAGIWNTLFYLKFTNLSLEKGQYKGKQDYHSLFKEWNKKKTFSEKRRLQISATDWGLTTRYLLIQVIRWCDLVDPALSSTWRQVTLWSPQHFNKSRKTPRFHTHKSFTMSNQPKTLQENIWQPISFSSCVNRWWEIIEVATHLKSSKYFFSTPVCIHTNYSSTASESSHFTLFLAQDSSKTQILFDIS